MTQMPDQHSAPEQAFCAVCKSTTKQATSPAYVSHWTKRLLAKDPVTQLIKCATCKAGYFSFRYSVEDMELLYRQYRSAKYQRNRQRDEPYYTKGLNKTFTEGQRFIAERKLVCTNKLQNELDSGIQNLHKVLDFGGDRGQFVPTFTPHQKSYLFDISMHETIDSVTPIQSAADLQTLEPDLVLLTHVLEHAIDPRELVTEIFVLLPPGGLLYIEVPLDEPSLSPSFEKKWYQAWNQIARKRASVSMMADLYAKALKKTLRKTSRLSLIRQSEHLNFFNSSSLATLLTSVGFTGVGEVEAHSIRISRLFESQYLVALYEKPGRENRN